MDKDTKNIRIHEYLEIVEKQRGNMVIKCIKCGYEFCNAKENYKQHALLWESETSEFPLRSLYSGEPMFIRYQQFICPGCGTLLQVDQYLPELDKDEPILHDIQVKC